MTLATSTIGYYDQFKQGATLVPRKLCFIHPVQHLQPGDTAVNPWMKSAPDLNAEAKPPWKGIRLEGPVDPPNRFATLLSKNLLPFGTNEREARTPGVRTGFL